MAQLNPVTTAKKGGVSAGVAGGGVAFAYAVILVSRHFFHHEMTVDEALIWTGVITTGIAGAGRGVENIVKWYANLKHIPEGKK